MQPIISPEYSWEYVTASKAVEKGHCELIYARLVVTAGSTNSALYDGTDTNGKKITDLKDAAITDLEFSPPVPVYCDRGIYVAVGTSVSGILVIWRTL